MHPQLNIKMFFKSLILLSIFDTLNGLRGPIQHSKMMKTSYYAVNKAERYNFFEDEITLELLEKKKNNPAVYKFDEDKLLTSMIKLG